MASKQRYVVASVDLDKSRDARLHAARDLLSGERIEVELRRWDGRPAQVLVVGTETSASRMAVDTALRSGVPVVRIGRLPWDPDSVRSLDLYAEADELSACLRERIRAAEPPAEPTASAAPDIDLASAPFLRQLLAASESGACLLERGLFRLAIDPAGARLHMLRRMPYPDLIAEALAPNWFVTPLTPRRYAEEFEQDVTASYPLESVLWDIALAHDAPIADVAPDRAVRLRAWPLLSANALPAHWLLPLSCLLERAWALPQLAQATATPALELERLYAAVLASGLADGADIAAAPSPRRAPDAQAPGLLRRLARRFGLNLGRGP
ncbi:hypothetical protein J5226_01130 [Lysobacter sp. K5869]|uniref:hypothetical protein n=1 Tax=Lysobacter sp. K5869 TaxID=2820808 RepID=UPI001C0640D9|nr:hypothetical protein [Lysobacter sp. K5869]QWP77039.1 hypothetical protein J5226_01130 [Lysobacter sp. K5869]